MEKEIVRLTTDDVRKQFNVFGITVSIYGLLILFITNFIGKFLNLEFIVNIKNNLGVGLSQYFDYGVLTLFLILATIIPFVVFKSYRKMKLKEFVRVTKIKITDLLLMTIFVLGSNLLLIFIFTLITRFISSRPVLLLPIGFNLDFLNLGNPLLLVLLIVILPLIEEFVYRGILLRYLGQFGNYFGIFAVSLLFGLAHGSLVDGIPAFGISYLLCLITLRYHSILPSIFIRMCINAFMVLINIIQAPIIIAVMVVVIYAVGIYAYIRFKKNKVIVKKEKLSNLLFRLFFSNVFIIISLIILLANNIIGMFI